MDDAYQQDVAQAEQALQREDFETAFGHRERAHVLAQRITVRHTYLHWRMPVAGLRRGDGREAVGQVPRIVASILFSRLWVPRGNSGRVRVSALQPMPVPADLRPSAASRAVTRGATVMPSLVDVFVARVSRTAAAAPGMGRGRVFHPAVVVAGMMRWRSHGVPGPVAVGGRS